MRLGVLDVGSNTIHLLVVKAGPGGMPVPEASEKSTMRLMKYLQPDGAISAEGVEHILTQMRTAADLIAGLDLDEFMPMATSALREAKNGEKVLKKIRKETGIDLKVMSGEEEASVTFLAVRRWFGWSAGRIMLIDIGGGSLELAAGANELPDLAMSVPLGAGRLTRRFLETDPPTQSELKSLRRHIRDTLPDAVRAFGRLPEADHFVGSSKTIRSLARLAGSVIDGVGPTDRVTLRKWQLDDWVPRLAQMPALARPALPGVTRERTHQIVAGGIVMSEVMDAFGIDELDVSPWAMREGVLLDYLDRLPRPNRGSLAAS